MGLKLLKTLAFSKKMSPIFIIRNFMNLTKNIPFFCLSIVKALFGLPKGKKGPCTFFLNLEKCCFYSIKIGFFKIFFIGHYLLKRVLVRRYKGMNGMNQKPFLYNSTT